MRALVASSRVLRRAASVSFVGRAPLAGVMQPRAIPRMSTQPSRSLFVRVETTPNPDSLKFIPDERQVLPESLGTGMHFSDMAQAKGSKLVRRLLKTKEITGVFLGRDFISVNKQEDISWTPLKPIVLDAIMDAYAELDSDGTPIVEPPKAADAAGGGGGGATTGAAAEDDDEVVAMIKELLETRIRPAVQEDGGDIFYVAFDHESGVVKVRMAGSCVGCPSSTATLRNGVENMLMHYIPEVKAIEQVTTELEELGKKELKTMEERLKATGAEV